MMKGIELTNQEKIRTLEEKENYKYLGISEADTIPIGDKKKKIKRNLRGRNNLKPNNIAYFPLKG